MAKKHLHDNAAILDELMEKGKLSTDNEFIESLNILIINIEKDDSYSTRRKLKIFDLMTQLSNCAEKERRKFARRLRRQLK